jgi:hypothetical protein
MNDSDSNYWIFSDADIENTPSRKDGITFEMEKIKRWQVCSGLLQICDRLGL